MCGLATIARQPSAISSIRRCAASASAKASGASGPTSASMKAPTTQAAAMRGSQSRNAPCSGRCGSGARTPRPAPRATPGGRVDLRLAGLDDHGVGQPAALERALAKASHRALQAGGRRAVAVDDGRHHIALAARDDWPAPRRTARPWRGSSGRRCRWRRRPSRPRWRHGHGASRPRRRARAQRPGCARGCPRGGLRRTGCADRPWQPKNEFGSRASEPQFIP